MKIAQEYNHLNAREFLIVHHHKTYKEILSVIEDIKAEDHLTKVSAEKTKMGHVLFNPSTLNIAFKEKLITYGWKDTRRDFFVSTDPDVVKQLESLDYDEQKKLLTKLKLPLHDSYNQTDFVKNKIAIEVQLGKYFAVTYDLFVKHLSFYNASIIDAGIEILPTKAMQQRMSSGISWFEKEVHNVLRHGRTNPPVPVLMLGIEP